MAVKGNKKQNSAFIPNKWFLPLSVFIILITSISLYHKSVNNAYLDLDDMTFFMKDYAFIKNISNAPKAFTQGVFQGAGAKDTGESYYRPMLILSFMLDAQISPSSTPENPSLKPFFRANIFYHAFASVLLLMLLLELNISAFSSLLLALIFTAHPLLNQAVAWIPGRNDPLMSISILLSFIFLLKYHKSKKISQFSLHILFFVLALFTKENAIMFIPLVFIVLRFVYKEPFATGDYKKLGFAYILCIIPWFFIRQYSLSTDRSISTPYDAFHNLLINSPYFIQYAGKAILPVNLSVMSMAQDTNYFLGLFAIALLAVSVYFSRQKNIGYLIIGVSWFLLFITPTFASGFSGLEHRTYLPLMGIMIVVSQLDIIKKTTSNQQQSALNQKHIIGFVLLSAIFITFYALSASRLYIFHDRFYFDKSAMETSPHSTTPATHLAKEYELIGDYNNAIIAYREALKRDTNAEMLHNDIAGEYILMGAYPEAEKELKIELAKHPNNHIAVFNLGFVVFKESRDYPNCIALLKKSISMDSSFTQAYRALSQVYQSMGDSVNTILYRNLYYQKLPKS
jgi:protein O-mannosyl-transferase